MPTAVEANTDSRQQGGDNAKSSLKCKDYAAADTVVDEGDIGNFFGGLKVQTTLLAPLAVLL